MAVYLPGDSLLHRTPAGVKLSALVIVAAASIVIRQPWQTGVLLVVVLAAYAVARIRPRHAWAHVRPMIWLLLLLVVFQLIVNSWETTVVVVGQLVALVLLAGLVSLTTRTTALVDAVVSGARVLRPLGIDPERVGLMLALGIRSVPVVVGLAQDVRDAQRARGLEASPMAFAVPLLVRALRHADRLGDALVARGVDD